jgi:hypothetical protein
MYHFFDLFFVVFHSVLILFNLFGWIWRKTRRLNLITLLLTGASWFILGIFYGIGYCPLTDWHWNVLRKLGQNMHSDSYISYLIHRLTGFLPNDQLVDSLTVILYFLALFVSLYVNLRRRRGIKQEKPGKI